MDVRMENAMRHSSVERERTTPDSGASNTSSAAMSSPFRSLPSSTSSHGAQNAAAISDLQSKPFGHMFDSISTPTLGHNNNVSASQPGNQYNVHYQHSSLLSHLTGDQYNISHNGRLPSISHLSRLNNQQNSFSGFGQFSSMSQNGFQSHQSFGQQNANNMGAFGGTPQMAQPAAVSPANPSHSVQQTRTEPSFPVNTLTEAEIDQFIAQHSADLSSGYGQSTSSSYSANPYQVPAVPVETKPAQAVSTVGASSDLSALQQYPLDNMEMMMQMYHPDVCCLICRRTFPTSSDLNEHLKTHIEDLAACQPAAKQAKTEKDAFAHLTGQQAEDEKVPAAPVLADPMKTQSSDQSYQGQPPDYPGSTDLATPLATQMAKLSDGSSASGSLSRIDDKSQPLAATVCCYLCQQTFTSLHELNQHMESIHTSTPTSRAMAQSGAAMSSGGVTAQTGPVSTQGGQMAGHASAHLTQLSNVPLQVSSRSAQMNDQPGQINNQPRQINNQPGQMSLQPGHMNVQASRMNTHPGQVVAQQGQMNTQQGQMTTLQGQMTTQQGQMNIHQGQLNIQRGQMNSQAGQMNSHQERMNAQQGQINSQVTPVNYPMGDVSAQVGQQVNMQAGNLAGQSPPNVQAVGNQHVAFQQSGNHQGFLNTGNFIPNIGSANDVNPPPAKKPKKPAVKRAPVPKDPAVKKKWPCPECGKVLSRADKLKCHMKSQHQDIRHGCPFCDKVFTTPERLNEHKRKHTGEKPYVCTVCSKAFAQAGHLRRHMKTHPDIVADHVVIDATRRVETPDMQFPPKVHTPDNPFPTPPPLTRNVHTPDSPFANQVLTRNVPTPENQFTSQVPTADGQFLQPLTRAVHTPESPFQGQGPASNVQSSEDQFSSQFQPNAVGNSAQYPIAAGGLTPSDDAAVDDDVKPDSFKESINIVLDDIEATLAEQTALKPHSCEFCGQAYVDFGELRQHECSKPTMERRHVCSKCGQAFLSNMEYSAHIQTHRHKCVDCDQEFTTAALLTEHKAVHAVEKPFVCETCGKTFKRQMDVERHQVSHSTEKPFQCDVCFTRFKRNDKLKIHMRLHTGEKPYECTMCDAKFCRKDHLNKHVKKHEKESSGGPESNDSSLRQSGESEGEDKSHDELLRRSYEREMVDVKSSLQEDLDLVRQSYEKALAEQQLEKNLPLSF